MRYIFISLVFANLCVAIWGLFFDGSESNAVDPVSSASSVSKSATDKVLHNYEESADAASAENSASPKLCELVGPFESDSNAEDFVARLKSIDIRSAIQSVELPAGSSYWVHLPPEESREAAFRRLAELQSQKIESYVIGSGPLANAVSLGVFTIEGLADEHLVSLNSLGLQALKTEFERKELELWVEIQPLEAEKMSDSTWRRMLDGMTAQERRQNFCLPVAS